MYVCLSVGWKVCWLRSSYYDVIDVRDVNDAFFDLSPSAKVGQ